MLDAIAPELAMKNKNEKYCLKKIASGKIPNSIVKRLKSSLPKDQSIGFLYQKEFKKIAADPITADLIGYYLNWSKIKLIANKPNELMEKERALLFKVIVFYYWFKQLP